MPIKSFLEKPFGPYCPLFLIIGGEWWKRNCNANRKERIAQFLPVRVYPGKV
jgi:hypothetical protein